SMNARNAWMPRHNPSAPSITRMVASFGGVICSSFGPGARAMPKYPAISVRQPRPFDIVDNPVHVCGVGTGFEGVFEARVRDGNGAQIAHATIHAGGTGVWGNYDVSMP